MNNELTIKIAGEAGQGMQTIGTALCKICKDAGLNIFANHDYMSRIRGGNNFFQLRVSTGPVFTLRQKSDIVIALDKNSVGLYQNNLTDGGVLVFDKDEFKADKAGGHFFHAPLYAFARQAGNALYVNSAACGLAAGLLRLEFNYLEGVLKSVFYKKSQEVVAANIAAGQAGYDYARQNFKQESFALTPPKARADREMLLNGNEAIGLAALYAGCKFYTAYPMSPSTGIMNLMAHYAQRCGIIVEQAEDELAAVNMAIGASFAGARAMTATSGGGFALMAEGLSLAAMTETPLVVVDAQRPAPATGFPTRTEQADLEFLLHAGHGEFARAIYAPGSIEDCFYLTMKAFNLAEKYQVPVLIMTDQHLADSYRNIAMLDPARIAVERHIISKEESGNVSGYRRYALNESGISPRAIPSWINEAIYADSDEHDQGGHITEDGAIRIEMVQKRYHKKMKLLAQECEMPSTQNLQDAKTILIGFGSTWGVMKEACAIDNSLGMIHFSQVWPLPLKALSEFPLNNKRLLTVENNATAQLARLLRLEAEIRTSGSILKFDGRPMDIEYLISRLERQVK